MSRDPAPYVPDCRCIICDRIRESWRAYDQTCDRAECREMHARALGAAALTAAHFEIGRLREHLRQAQGAIAAPVALWHPIATVPVNTLVMLCCDRAGNRFICTGIIYPSSGPGAATHWMPMPALPNAPDNRAP
jgi:hypothetical protein